MLSSIPAPPFNSIGPFRLYGLMIALGVLAAVWLAQRRYRAAGGDPDVISNLAFVAVPAGLIGARLYHVITDWPKYNSAETWTNAFKIWQGGLGIPGGIICGTLAGLIYVRAKRLNLGVLLDVAAPCLPIAQALGRWGNYFNQELFGRPTSLPWGLEVDPLYRPDRYRTEATFHPTFLYESLWNLALAALIIAIGSRKRLRSGKLFPLYVGGYFLGRMWVEELRSDPAAMLGGVRWNFVFAIVMVVVSAAWLLWRGPLRRDGDPEPLTIAPGSPGSIPLESAAVEGDDLVGEPGPQLDRPGSEGASAEPDERDAEVGVNPQEGS